MPRRPRLRLAGVPFHVIQRGNDRQRCFFADSDYELYLSLVHQRLAKYDAAVHAYVLMTNHIHLLMTPAEPAGIGRVMQGVGQTYAQYVNRRYGRTGGLWDGRFRSALVDTDSYLLTLHRYIEANPVRAAMVGHPRDYRWSSYRANAEDRADPLVTRHALVAALGRDEDERRQAYRGLFDVDLDASTLELIRTRTNGGFALGSKQFETDLAHVLARPVKPRLRRRRRNRLKRAGEEDHF
jgi:putative transposase